MSYEVSSQTSYFREKINIDTNIEWKIKDTIEILQAEIEILNLELCYKNQELEKIQKLKSTKHVLRTAINPKQLNLDGAIKLAKNLLVTGKPTKDFLTELLTAIYGSLVTEEQLEPTEDLED